MFEERGLCIQFLAYRSRVLKQQQITKVGVLVICQRIMLYPLKNIGCVCFYLQCSGVGLCLGFGLSTCFEKVFQGIPCIFPKVFSFLQKFVLVC